MHIANTLILLFMAGGLAAGEAAAPTGGGVSTILITIIGMIVTAVVGWLIAKFGFSKTVDTTPIDPKMPVNEAKNFFIDKRLIPFVISTGEHWLLTQIPVLVLDATDGDGFQWDKHWAELRVYVKERVSKKFAAENQDVLDYLGSSEELDDLLDRQLMKLLTNLPESLRQFIPESLVDSLTDKAKDFLIDKGKDLLGRAI